LASANQEKPAFHRKLETPTRRVELSGQTLRGEKGDPKRNFLQIAFPNDVLSALLRFYTDRSSLDKIVSRRVEVLVLRSVKR